MKTSIFLPLGLALTLGCTDSKVSPIAAQSSPSQLNAAAVGASTHGMVLFGNETLFLSHIPMFMSPHDYQALLQVQLSHATLDALAVYQKAAKASTGEQGLFTIRPKPFVLPNLLNGKIKSFQADVYRGNFEQGGRVILSNVTVTVDEILYVSPLKKTSAALEQLSYIPVDTPDASYLVHQITAPQNFDHIVQIQWINEPLPTAVKVNLRSFLSSDKEANRLQAGQYFTIAEDGSISESLSPAEASFQVVSDFYCTQGPDFFNLCD